MRAAAERLLVGEPRFRSVNATAEATTLPNHSVDLIIAGQAFHWFDQTHARAEFTRILKPNGWVALLWNERLDATPFLRAYDQLLATFGTDYHVVRHETISPDVVRAFFAPQPVQIEHWPNTQRLDYTGLEGRLLSSSYTPREDDQRYRPMLAQLRRIFDSHQENGFVTILYNTIVYASQLPPAGDRL